MIKTMQSLLTAEHKKVIADVLDVARERVRRRGRRLSDLRFAKRTIHGYAFFEVGHELWEILHEIAQEVFSRNPHYDFAFVVELCSEIVNTDEEALSSLGLAV